MYQVSSTSVACRNREKSVAMRASRLDRLACVECDSEYAFKLGIVAHGSTSLTLFDFHVRPIEHHFDEEGWAHRSLNMSRGHPEGSRTRYELSHYRALRCATGRHPARATSGYDSSTTGLLPPAALSTPSSRLSIEPGEPANPGRRFGRVS